MQPSTPRALVLACTAAALAGAWDEHGAPPRGWLAPFVDDAGSPRYGHPVLFGRSLLGEIGRLRASEPLRDLRS